MKNNCRHLRVADANYQFIKAPFLNWKYKSIFLFCLFLILGLNTLDASHIKGTITWEETKTTNEIKFTVITSWKNTCLSSDSSVGETVSTDGYLYFGDGNSVKINSAIITKTSISENRVTTVFTITHTYNNEGNYVVSVLSRNPDDDFKIKAIVNVGCSSADSSITAGLQYNDSPLPENKSKHCLKPGSTKSFTLKEKGSSRRIVAKVHN